MGAIVKSGNAARYMRGGCLEHATPAKGQMAIIFGQPIIVTAIGGDKDGETLSGTIKAGQKVKLGWGDVLSTQYNILFTANPELAEWCQVQSAWVLEPGDPQTLTLIVKTDKALDLTKIQWLLKATIID